MRILAISDLHAPFNHPAALDFLADVRREVKPHVVVCVGDEIDAHGWSRHDRHPDAPGQGEELKQATAVLKALYKLIGPKCLVCTSNHQQRHLKKHIRAGLPSAFMKDYADVIEAPKGWRWADRHIVDGNAFIHGEGYGGPGSAMTAAVKHRRPTVIGHVHSWAGIAYHCNGLDTIWGMNVGCLVDPDSIGMQYAAKGQNMQVLGTGAVIDGVPALFPLKV